MTYQPPRTATTAIRVRQGAPQHQETPQDRPPPQSPGRRPLRGCPGPRARRPGLSGRSPGAGDGEPRATMSSHGSTIRPAHVLHHDDRRLRPGSGQGRRDGLWQKAFANFRDFGTAHQHGSTAKMQDHLNDPRHGEITGEDPKVLDATTIHRRGLRAALTPRLPPRRPVLTSNLSTAAGVEDALWASSGRNWTTAIAWPGCRGASISATRSALTPRVERPRARDRERDAAFIGPLVVQRPADIPRAQARVAARVTLAGPACAASTSLKQAAAAPRRRRIAPISGPRS